LIRSGRSLVRSSRSRSFSTIASAVPRRSTWAIPASSTVTTSLHREAPARFGDVAKHLFFQRLDTFELGLAPKPLDEFDPHGFAVNVLAEIENERFDQAAQAVAKRWPDADRHRGLPALAGDFHETGVDSVGRNDHVLRLEQIRRGKT